MEAQAGMHKLSCHVKNAGGIVAKWNNEVIPHDESATHGMHLRDRFRKSE